MQKKLIALAVAGVASTAAFAQSNVTIYGDLKPSYDSIKVQDQNGRYNSISSNNSNIGFKGEENLGNGLKAIFQIESGVGIGGTRNVDNAYNAPQGGLLGGRNTFVGLKGGFGEVTVGRRDTAYKTSTGSYDPFADTIGDYNNIIGSGIGGSSGHFDLRADSSINYISPTVLGGLKLAYAYAQRTDNVTQAQDDNVSSYALTYDIGGLNLVGAYEKQNGSASAGTQNRQGAKFGAKYNFGAASVFGLYERLDTVDNTGNTERKRNAFYLGGTYAIGAIDLMATYAKAKKETGNGTTAGADTAANVYSLGARYNLSKRTNVAAIYTDLDNKAAGTYTLNMKGGINTTGQDAKGFSVRLQHKF